ncbi:MAG TPA: hypothetical protein VGX91_13135 [Candidatus Cybelea sp.]|jgi:hypothetical protein|nr:hypothetical protein [Candidatus Cybelea sp.]
MRRLATTLSTALAIGAMLLASACGGSAGGGVPAAPGAAVRTIAGDGVTIASRSLGRPAVSVREERRALLDPPNSAWKMVPITLRAAFATPLRRSDGAEAGVLARLTYPRDYAAAILAARAPVVEVRYAGAPTLRWVALGRFEPARDRVTVELPSALMNGATELTLGLGIDNPDLKLEKPGPRYWNGKSWSDKGTIVSGKSTVVLIHGIFSSVESAYPSTCPQKIANAGKFAQVLGFDYAWNEPPSTEGPLFGDFLKQIAAAKVGSLSIEAHSYGSLVSLAAVPFAEKDVKIDNLVTMGGPLPLRGTPLANKDNHWRMGLVLGLLAWVTDEPPSTIDRAYKSGMVASLATNSDELQKILAGVKGMTNKPKFVEVAGTDWICFIPGVVSGCWYSEEKFKKVLLDGSGVETPWDGVVEKIAANSTDIPNPVASAFKLSHIDLQCNANVISWVGKQLR